MTLAPSVWELAAQHFDAPKARFATPLDLAQALLDDLADLDGYDVANVGLGCAKLLTPEPHELSTPGRWHFLPFDECLPGLFGDRLHRIDRGFVKPANFGAVDRGYRWKRPAGMLDGIESDPPEHVDKTCHR